MVSGLVRRLLDLVASLVGLVLLAPVMAVIGLLVRRDSPGPVIFAQERVGRGGKPFTLYKFRTMRVDSAAGPSVTASGDSRVTRIGARLRSTKADELPQLVNVAKGDMSLVGPRPEVAKYVALWTDEQRRDILSVRPVITDPVTLELRREEEILAAQPDPERHYRTVLLPAKAVAYQAYVTSRTLGSDLVVIARTLRSVVME